jgi:branched-chain amino acid transport system substrate-binding protein
MIRQHYTQRSILLFVLILLIGIYSGYAQTSPVFRIGVLDAPTGALARGAQLAVSEINQAGGVVGADGTVFQLQLVIQSPDDMQFALSNILQARVIAVIGPSDPALMLTNRQALADLGVPILTAAADDTIIANDNTQRIFRIRAQEILQGQALASYLLRDLGAATIATVQLDVNSTASVVGFTRSLNQLGINPSQQFLLTETTSLQQIVLNVVTSMPQFVAAFGAPEAVAQLYTDLRKNDWPGGFAYNQAGSVQFRSRVPENLLEGVIGVSTWSYTYDDERSQEFVNHYIRMVGELPADLAASGYDAVYLMQSAIGKPGTLQSNLVAIQGFEGVQGAIRSRNTSPGEMSDNVGIVQLGEHGAPVAVARFASGARIPLGTDQQVTLPTPTPMIVATSTPEGVYVIITRSVQNIRTGPGLNYDILGQLSQNEQARVIGATVDFSWVAIEYRGTVGWLSRGILEMVGDTITVPVLTPPPSPTPLPATATPTPQPFPDLVITGAQPNRLIIGTPFTVVATVLNQGGTNAGPFAVAASFEPGGIYSAINLPGMLAGTQTTVSFTGMLSGATGPQNVTIIADLNGQVNEGAGESNNFAFVYSYIADAPLLTSALAVGTLSVAELGTAVLDGGGNDIQWGGGGLVPLGATQMVSLSGFATIDQVHRDAIAAAPLVNLPITSITPGQLIGIRTDGANKYGVLQVVSVQPGVQITFNFRMYDF